MINIFQVIIFHSKRLISSGFTYFGIGIIILLIIARDFRKEQIDTTTDQQPSTQEQIISYALSLRGIDYRSGGFNTEGFDCSGFTSFVFKKFGYRLPRSSESQFQAGRKVDLPEAEPSDLIFFKGRNLRASSIGHVGIVVTRMDNDNLAFIHASTSEGVRIDSLSTPYYRKRLVGIRKMFINP